MSPCSPLFQNIQAGGGVAVDHRAIEFSFPSPPPRPSRPEACGLRHLALACDDAEAMRGHLQDQGVSVEAIRVDEYTGARFFFCADPDGLPIEFYQAAPTA
ncbi:VOC family protein [Chromobacterium vaccinii]|uniref:VOC family protein n=1 Tax=Chromobacterium vaccinii TaxID=1108595 RepID=UPI00326104FC